MGDIGSFSDCVTGRACSGEDPGVAAGVFTWLSWTWGCWRFAAGFSHCASWDGCCKEGKESEEESLGVHVWIGCLVLEMMDLEKLIEKRM
jgi:hypothetical protein